MGSATEESNSPAQSTGYSAVSYSGGVKYIGDVYFFQ